MMWCKRLLGRFRSSGTAARSLVRDGMSRMSRMEPLFATLTRNIDYVTTFKLRRTHQWIRFYCDLWSKERLKQLLIQMGKRIIQKHYKRRMLFLSGAAVCARPLDQHKDEAFEKNPKPAALISDDVIKSHMRDLDYVHKLTAATLTCKSCQKRHLIDQPVDGIQYCSCSDKKASVYGFLQPNCTDDDTCWAPFLERKDVIVWRREHPEYKGLYAYKMYGKFDDVTAQEFLEVQMDLSEFRLQWDISTAQCHIIKQDEEKGQGYSSDVNQLYYWEVNWPRLFSNRDYVCARRAIVQDSPNSNERCIIVYSKSSNHTSCPEKSKTVRVQDYVSVLAIKPFTEFGKPGIEFSLTAFENPGLSLPSSITTWVALRGMPEFMNNLRQACLEMRKWKKLPLNDNKDTTAPTKEPSYIETPQNRPFSSRESYA